MGQFLHKRRAGLGAGTRLALVLVTTLAPGCLHLRQQLQIHRDGSLTASYEYSVPAATLPTLRRGRGIIETWQGLAPGADLSRLNWILNREAVARHFSGFGIELNTYRSYEKKGRHYVEINVRAAAAREALRSGRFGAFSLQRTESGDVLFSADVIRTPAAREPRPEELARLRELCDGLRLRLDVRVPTEILASTATETSAQEHSWVFDPQVDPEILVRTPPIRLLFRGTGLDWMQAD